MLASRASPASSGARACEATRTLQPNAYACDIL
jgi:hypothetical protein